MVHCDKGQINCFGVHADLILGAHKPTPTAHEIKLLQDSLWSGRRMVYRVGIHTCDAKRELFVKVHENGETMTRESSQELFAPRFTQECN
jgi:hypothetical protein